MAEKKGEEKKATAAKAAPKAEEKAAKETPKAEAPKTDGAKTESAKSDFEPSAKSDFEPADSKAKPGSKRGKPVKQNVTEPDELSIDFEEEGKIVRKGLKKEVLSKGAWVTVVYLFQDLNRKKNEFGPPKVSITRYKKFNKVYQFQKEFTLSSAAQAKQFVETIQKWLSDGSLPADAGGGEEEA